MLWLRRNALFQRWKQCQQQRQRQRQLLKEKLRMQREAKLMQRAHKIHAHKTYRTVYFVWLARYHDKRKSHHTRTRARDS